MKAKYKTKKKNQWDSIYAKQKKKTAQRIQNVRDVAVEYKIWTVINIKLIIKICLSKDFQIVI